MKEWIIVRKYSSHPSNPYSSDFSPFKTDVKFDFFFFLPSTVWMEIEDMILGAWEGDSVMIIGTWDKGMTQ